MSPRTKPFALGCQSNKSLPVYYIQSHVFLLLPPLTGCNFPANCNQTVAQELILFLLLEPTSQTSSWIFVWRLNSPLAPNGDDQHLKPLFKVLELFQQMCVHITLARMHPHSLCVTVSVAGSGIVLGNFLLNGVEVPILSIAKLLLVG